METKPSHEMNRVISKKMLGSLIKSLRCRARGMITKISLMVSFPLRRSRVAWSTLLLLDAGSALQIGTGSIVRAYGSVAVAAGGTVAIGQRTAIMQGSEIAVSRGAKVEIGNDVYVGAYSNMRSSRRIKIGDNVHLAQFVSLVGGQHSFIERDRLIREQPFEEGDVVIEDDAWLGVGVAVLSGVTVGTGAVVGAGTIVTKDVAPYSIVVGNPARMVGERQA